MIRSPHACFTVDLDGLWCYREIHGLPRVEAPHDEAYTVGVRRLLDFLGDVGVDGTFFVIGKDLDDPAHRELLHEAVDAGHELGSHSWAHDYALRRRPMPEIRDDIRRAHGGLTELMGAPPVGFRTPGYNVDARILSILAELDYRYDSSVFPCPPYWLAKGAVMSSLALRGTPSRSDMTRVDTLWTPLEPYRPSQHSIRVPAPNGRSRFPIEVPMCVVPGVRFPVIGTSLHLVGARGFAALYPMLRRAHPRLLNLEFHAIDFMDAEDPGVADLVGVQPDLGIPWATKRERYARIVAKTRENYRFVTMAEAVEAL